MAKVDVGAVGLKAGEVDPVPNVDEPKTAASSDAASSEDGASKTADEAATNGAPVDGAVPTNGAAPVDGAVPTNGAAPVDGVAPTNGAAPAEAGPYFGYPGASPDEPKGSWVSRMTWFLLGATPLAVIITATFLTPSSAGHGTHTQLGLPPCGFLQSTGLPCPGCGLTTSFAHMVRFEWAGASGANAFGVALFLVSFFTIPISFYAMFRGLPVMATMERLQFEKVVVLLAACSTVVWCIRIATILF